MMIYNEPHFEERIKVAKDRAQRILLGQAESDEDFMFALIYVIDREKRMGIFHPYYQDRTIDELVFEAELTRGAVLTPVEQGAQAMQRATEDEKADFSRQLAKEFGDVIDDKFMADAMNFMNTGDFKPEETPKETDTW